MSTDTLPPLVYNGIRTFTGTLFTPLNPVVSDIHIEDISHSLSNLCRFAGHTREFYSVAQHSVYVSEIVPEEFALWGLLHDASEAYLVDLPRPVKHSEGLYQYRVYEYWLMQAIAKRFGLDPEESPKVKEADQRILFTEMRDLMSRNPSSDDLYPPLDFTIDPWAPHYAKHMFMKRFRELYH